jgi:hypothetical protein
MVPENITRNEEKACIMSSVTVYTWQLNILWTGSGSNKYRAERLLSIFSFASIER